MNEKIKKINNDNSLNNKEKNIAIQKLFNSSNIIKKINCDHYLFKKCNNFYFSCCNIFTNCIRCHNEINNDHSPIIKYITCKKCKLLQIPSNKCINSSCNIVFSKNYCKICFIWTHKNISHCNLCGFCRVGNNLFHCNNCDTCFDIFYKNSHECKNISYRNESCVFCLDEIFNSQYSFSSLKCNHHVHNTCLEKAIKSNIYKCPSCRKSFYNIDWNSLRQSIISQPLPLPDILIGDQLKTTFLGNTLFNINDIINNNGILTYKVSLVNNPYFIGYFNEESLIKNLKKVDILCNDCENKSNTLFHYLGNECSYCFSFNTLII